LRGKEAAAGAARDGDGDGREGDEDDGSGERKEKVKVGQPIRASGERRGLGARVDVSPPVSP